MAQLVPVPLEIAKGRRRFRLPSALQDRLNELLDRQTWGNSYVNAPATSVSMVFCRNPRK
jgi:hypothetical protein